MADEYKRVPVLNYEGEYEVDTLGNVFSLKRNKALKATDFGSKYLQVTLCKNGIPKVVKVHRLVAEAFIPNPNGLPQVNHKDENKHNNVVSNLEWCTPSYNYWYGTCPERCSAAKKGKSPSKETRQKQSVVMKRYWSEHKHPLRKLRVKCLNDGVVYTSYAEAGMAYGMSYKRVIRSCRKNCDVDGKQFLLLDS